MLTTKVAVPEQIKFFVAYVKTQFNRKIKIIRTNNGIEFFLPSFYSSKGILHQTSCRQTPQQNSEVEKKKASTPPKCDSSSFISV